MTTCEHLTPVKIRLQTLEVWKSLSISWPVKCDIEMKGNLEKDSGSVSLKFSTTLSLLFYKHCLKWLSCCDRYFNRKKKTNPRLDSSAFLEACFTCSNRSNLAYCLGFNLKLVSGTHSFLWDMQWVQWWLPPDTWGHLVKQSAHL